MPLAPLPALVRLQGAVTVDGDRVTFVTPRGVYLRQALLALVLAPVAGGLVAFLVLAAVGVVPAIVVAAALTLFLLALGVGRPLLLLAGATPVTLDLAARTWQRGADRGPLAEVTKVLAEQPSAGLTWRALRAHRTSGPPLPLLADLPPGHPHELLALAEWAGAAIGVPSRGTPDVFVRDVFGGGDRTAAALCYLPFQGIFLLASLWYLFRGRERPYVHFAARQSLVITAVWVPTVIGFVAVFAVAAAIPERGHATARALAIAIPALLLSVAWLGHFAARVVLCFRAWKGRVTVLPVLGRFAGPPPPDFDAG